MMRIPLELREYIDLEDGKLVEVKPVPEDLQGLADEFRITWDRNHDREDLTEYMSEPRVAYENSMYHFALQREIASLERWIHHDIDNYEMDMSEDLLAELKELERICRQVNRKMKKEAVEDAKSNK